MPMSQPRSFFIIYNPVAGRGCGQRTALELKRILDGRGLAATACATSARGDARQIAEQAIADKRESDPICVVACGGDGTMQEVANAVARAEDNQAIMGIAPAGRCNDFARALRIGKKPEQIAEVLAGGNPTRVDLGRVGDRYFCTIAAIGFDAAVSRFVNDMRMPLRGPAAYVYGTLRVLFHYTTPELRLRGDFDDYDGPVFMAATANTPWYGGSMKIAPAASPFDGKLDICLVGKTTRMRVLGMLRGVGSGKHVQLPEVQQLRTRRLVAGPIDPKARVEVWADGEPIGLLPLTVECVPGAINIMLAPQPADSAGA